MRFGKTQSDGFTTRLVVLAVMFSIAFAGLAGTALGRGGQSFIGVVNPFAVPCSGEQKKRDPCLSDKDVRRMRRAHVKWARWGFRWARVQPTHSPAFNWAEADDTIGTLANRGIRVLPVMTGTPKWAAKTYGTPPLKTRKARDGWRKFLKAAVRRYGPGGEYWTDPDLYSRDYPGRPSRPIKTWQIWNEQNIHGGSQTVSVKRYQRLVRISHDAIVAEHRRAKILLGGMPGYVNSPAWVYLHKLYKFRGFKRKFDAVALHPYAPDVKHVLFQIKAMRWVMAFDHDAHAGLWITELGWGSKHPRRGQPINKGRKGQKRMLKRTFPLLKRYHRRWRLRHAFWFRWRDPPRKSPGCTFCTSSGLFEYGEEPKPAWRAFKRITGSRR